MSKIGIGYCTYKRKENWKRLNLSKDWASEFVVVNPDMPQNLVYEQLEKIQNQGI